MNMILTVAKTSCVKNNLYRIGRNSHNGTYSFESVLVNISFQNWQWCLKNCKILF